MKTPRANSFILTLCALMSWAVAARSADEDVSIKLFGGALERVAHLIEPPTNQSPHTFTTTLRVLKADGLPKEFMGREMTVAFQAPDHLRLAAQWNNEQLVACRDGQEVWVDQPGKQFGLVGSPDQPLFSTAPERKETTPLGPIKLPLPSEQILVLPFLTDLKMLPNESVAGTECRVLRATPKPEAIRGFKLARFTLQLWIRESDYLPLRIAYQDGKRTDVQVEIVNPQFADAWPETKWKLQAEHGERVQTVARAHLTRFLEVAMKMMGEKVPTLGPATGERQVLARDGNGRLEEIDGTRVLFLKGTPEEMGHQEGTLLRKEIHDLVDHILYGVGVGS
ncbi:MAG TPA: hypothetical protein VHI52_15165, partial [Verrucomicrobiae bacterium]|nr:hypothetical protein [Verrucomicrobiae bacterium]